MNDISPLTRHPDVLYGPHQPELLRDETLADLLEASARRAPDQPALIAGDRRLTYRELDDLSHCYPREINAEILQWLNGV